MVCGKCKKEIEDKAVFCPYCGTSVSTNTETQDVSSDKKVNPKLVGLTILGFLFAPISLVVSIILFISKKNLQVALALISGFFLCFLLIVLSGSIYFVINWFGGDINPILYFILSYSPGFWIFCLIILFTLFILPNTSPVYAKKQIEKRKIVFEDEEEPQDNRIKENKKEDTILALIAIFLLFCMVLSITSGYYSSINPVGKTYAKYDKDGDIEFTITFSPTLIFHRKNLDLYIRSHKRFFPTLELLNIPYEYDFKKRKGELINYSIHFTISENILILSSSKYGNIPEDWNYKDSSANGMYIEIKK